MTYIGVRELPNTCKHLQECQNGQPVWVGLWVGPQAAVRVTQETDSFLEFAKKLASRSKLQRPKSPQGAVPDMLPQSRRGGISSTHNQQRRVAKTANYGRSRTPAQPGPVRFAVQTGRRSPCAYQPTSMIRDESYAVFRLARELDGSSRLTLMNIAWSGNSSMPRPCSSFYANTAAALRLWSRLFAPTEEIQCSVPSYCCRIPGGYWRPRGRPGKVR